MTRTLIGLVVALALTFSLVACKEKSTGEKLSDAAKAVGRDAKDAAQKTKKEAKDVADRAKKDAEEAKNK